MASNSGAEAEAPLDPRLIRIQKRLRLMMIIGLGTLGVGVVAVLIAIIYRFVLSDSSQEQRDNANALLAPPAVITGEITAEAVGLAPDAELVQQTLDGNRLALTFREGTDLVTVVVDLNTMEVINRLRMTE